ncbi:hypothetical protein JR316_0003046 [Psilocybe cubensis]|uniref:Uncharacterized protein n=2 Tax=Psilocybe cubensis TaxID=181762 RepID=A0ACB8H6P4_PSICU|nr:hypothetical protein JR316_0003046 [Psilocybe cubensis]KAH9483576.1 hypothetical protein JR316_0003046 [Psilocybe cubensis]
MFSRSFIQSALVLVFALQVHGHAAVAPVLGVSGNPVRADVKRPNNINPCGAGVNIASEFDSSTAAPADASGSFNGVVFNFNRLLDGSRQVSAAVDPTGTGSSFTPMTVTTNGDKVSQNLGSQPIVAQLPAGMVCTGGATKNKCLVQFKNVAGFGNCMVVSQDSNSSSNSTSSDDSSSTTVDSTSTATDSADLSTATDNVFSTDSSDLSTTSVADISSATVTAAAATATSTSLFGSSQSTGSQSTGSNLSGNSVASGIKGNIANKLTGLKEKLQGAAKVPGTRAARSLLAELAGIDH